MKKAGKIPIKLNTSELNKPTSRVEDILELELHVYAVESFICDSFVSST
jgi:hypothetical protein